MTQHDKILSYLKSHGSITPMDAFGQLHITKLSTRVNEMIKDGTPITKEWVRKKTQDGYEAYMRYRLGG